MTSVSMTSHIGAAQHDKNAKSNTISTGADLANVEKHNNHDYTEQDVARMQSNIDLSLKEYNQQYDRHLQKVERLDLVSSTKEIYHEEFDAAVAEYNKAQVEKGRANRQISDYFESISENEKQEVAVEGLIQIGEYDDWKGMTAEEKLRVVPILEAGLNVIATEIPGFKIAGASLHMNEGSPHIHYVGVCVDESKKKKGLNKRVGKSAVFTKDVLSEVLQNRLREVMEPMVKETFDWDFKTKKTGRNQDLSKNEYVNQKLQEENKALEKQNEQLMSAKTVLETDIDRLEAAKEEASIKAQEAANAAEKAQKIVRDIDEQILAARKELDSLDAPEAVKDIKGTRTLTGKIQYSEPDSRTLHEYANKSAVAVYDQRRTAGHLYATLSDLDEARTAEAAANAAAEQLRKEQYEDGVLRAQLKHEISQLEHDLRLAKLQNKELKEQLDRLTQIADGEGGLASKLIRLLPSAMSDKAALSLINQATGLNLESMEQVDQFRREAENRLRRELLMKDQLLDAKRYLQQQNSR